MDTVENGTVEDRSPRLAGSMASSPAVSPAQIAHSTSPPCESPPAHFHSPPRSLPYPFFSKPPSGLPHGLLADYSNHGPLASQLPPAPPTSSDRSPYSPPPIACSDPGVNECKLVDYRGHKVAAFIINGESMLCLPQAFELFLKHLVGGLHTVYTKLKRLDIVPLVCNVEQVRILRGLGSIQPGVNRCKLLSVKEFDILFRDCTTARPGRPPKRAPGFSMNPSPDGMMKFKHPRMDNGDFFDNGHIRDSIMDKSPLLSNGFSHPPHLNPLHYMALNHPAAAAQAAQAAALFGPAAAAGLPGLPAAGGALSRIPEPTALVKPPHTVSQELINRSAVWENCRAAYEDVVKHLERLKDQRAEVERQNVSFDVKPRDLSVHCGSPSGPSPVLNLSKSADGSNSEGHVSNRDDEEEDDDDRLSDANEHDEKEVDDMSDSEGAGRGDLMGVIGEGGETALRPSAAMTPPSSLAPPMVGWPAHLTAHLGSVAHMGSPALVGSAAHMSSSAHVGSTGGSSVVSSADPALSSTENLLRNIQGLLKVATDNARQQERSINYEKAELKMGLMREKEVRQGLERKLQDEQKLRLVYQRRLKKERRFRRRLQEQMGGPPQPQQLQLSAAARLHQQLENSCRTSSAEQYLPMMTDKGKDMAAMRTLSAKIEPSVSSPMSLEPRSVFYGAAPMFSPAT